MSSASPSLANSGLLSPTSHNLPTSDPSPREMNSSSRQAYAAKLPRAEQSQTFVQGDLAGLISGNHEEVLTDFLRVGDVAHAEDCACELLGRYQNLPVNRNPIRQLKRAVATQREQDMYAPLVSSHSIMYATPSKPEQISLLNDITQWAHSGGSKHPSQSRRRRRRLWIDTHAKPPTIDKDLPYYVNVPKRKPDISLVDVDDSVPIDILRSLEVYMRHVAAPAEVKCSQMDGPISTAHPMNVTATAAQVGDCVRVHLALRPFQLYSYAPVFHGMLFTIMRWDRRGAIISKAYDIEKNFELFVRVVKRLAQDMTPFELGIDPRLRLANESILWSVAYPSYGFEMFGTSVTSTGATLYHLRTEGPPIWVSVGLMGRCTVVWKVVDVKAGNSYVYKFAYRSVERQAEASIYRAAVRNSGHIKGLARFEAGDDVPGTHVSRQRTLTDGLTIVGGAIKHDVIGHNLLLRSRGRSLVQYRSTSELLGALISNIEGSVTYSAIRILDNLLLSRA